MFLLAVLKLSPYDSDDDDLSSFVASLALCLATLCAMVLSYAGDSTGDAQSAYAFLFGFLQFAFGKAALMSFSGILQCAAGVLFTLPGLKKEWVGVLIFISAGMQYVAMILVIARQPQHILNLCPSR